MKHGFTLIEVLIAILIASIISGILFTVWFQINRGVGTVQTFIDLYAKEAMIQQNLERDFAGAFYPVPLAQPPKGERKETEQKKESQQKKSEKESTESEKDSSVSKAFYATKQGDQLGVITCITNNPAQVYWSDTAGEGKPRIVRVVYRLVPQENKTGQPTYKLMRQESMNLNFDAFQEGSEQSIRSFEVVNDIKSLQIQYTGLVITLEEKEGKTEPKRTLEMVDIWDSDKRVEKALRQAQDEKSKEEQNVYRAEIPSIITFKFTLLNETKKRERSFSIMVPVPIDTTPYTLQQLRKQKEQAEQKNQGAQPGTAPAKTEGGPKTSVETDQITIVISDTQGKPSRGPGMDSFFKHAGQFMQQLQEINQQTAGAP